MIRILLVISLFVVAMLSADAQSPPSNTPGPPRSIYVAEFVSREISDKALLTSFTDLYETALIGSGAYRVVNRRVFHQILAEAQSELSVRSMGDVSQRARGQLTRLAEAEGVVFGEVTDDAASGDVIITVTLETFDSVRHWRRFTLMKRGELTLLANRVKAMQQLVSATTAPGAPDIATSRVAASNYLFELIACRRDGRVLTCEMEVLNNGEVRDLSISLRKNSRTIDDSSFTTVISDASIAGQGRKWNGALTQTLLSGRPTNMSVTFSGVSTRARIVGRLELMFRDVESRKEFPVVFENIPIRSAP